jgi:hypothetical protein
MKECRLCMLVRESGQRQVLHDYHPLTSFTQTNPYVQNLLCHPLSPGPSHITQFNANQARDNRWASSLTLQHSPTQVIVSLDSYRPNTSRTSETRLTTSSSPSTYFDTVNSINSRWWEEAAYKKLRSTHNVNEIAIILRFNLFQDPTTTITILSARGVPFLNTILNALQEIGATGTVTQYARPKK